MAILSRLFWHRVSTAWQRWWHVRGRLSAGLNETLGVRVVKAFAQEEREIARFNPRSPSSPRRISAPSDLDDRLPDFLLVTGFRLAVGLVHRRAELLGRLIYARHTHDLHRLPGMFYGPLQFLNRSASGSARMLASAERVFDILDSGRRSRRRTTAVRDPTHRGRVQFART